MKRFLLLLPFFVAVCLANRGEISIERSDSAALQASFASYRDAARVWAVSRERFYEDKDLVLEARYAEAKMRWEHAKSDVAIKYLTTGGKLEAGWEDGAQFDWGLGRIVHADGNDFLIHLPEDMRMDWSIELYLPK